MSQHQKTMEDLPPEMMTIVLEHLIFKETRNNTLRYRLVNRQWKEIVDSLISKRIVSGDFKTFPKLKIFGAGGQRQYSRLHVWINTNSAMFLAGENSIPFTSLLLAGNRNARDFRETPRPRIPMTLPVFLSTFGGNLTTFALHDQIIPFSNLATILGSMPTLKQLRLVDVRMPKSHIKPGTLAPPPPLPNLDTLEVKSSFEWELKDERRNILYVWLVASYADQLVSLNLDTSRMPFPALQQRHLYSHRLPNGKSLHITTTSDSAFGKLKELKVFNASFEFMQLSKTPVLRNLTVMDIWNGIPSLLNVTAFMDKLSSTLEKLRLDVNWPNLVGRKSYENDGVTNNFEFSRGVSIPKLKTLAIFYPLNEYCEQILNPFLVKFPALEVLQLIYFRCLDVENVFIECQNPSINVHVEEIRNEIAEGASEIGTLKERLVGLRQEIYTMMRTLDVMRQRYVAYNEIEERRSAMVAAKLETVAIFQRLDALGEKKEKVITEQMLKRQGIWGRYPNLKIISVSKGDPEVDQVEFCLLRRPDDFEL